MKILLFQVNFQKSRYFDFETLPLKTCDCITCDNFDCIGIVLGRLTSWVLFTYGISYTFRTFLKTTDFRVVLIKNTPFYNL